MSAEAPPSKVFVHDIRQERKVMSLAVMDNIAVFVVAREEEQEEWRFIASKNGEAVMEGTIHGGKNAAGRYVKFVRNGVMSRAQKVRRNHQRRKEAADADT